MSMHAGKLAVPTMQVIPIIDGELYYCRAWLTALQADDCYRQLQDELEWRQDSIRVFSRWHKIPRLQAWHGDSDARYRYSGKCLQPKPWTARLTELKEKLTVAGFRANSVLANWYRNGHDKMGWYSDNEPELGPEPVIASVSLGAERTFQLRHRSSGQRIDIQLEHGSLLIMAGSMQTHWQHALPPRKRVSDGRINLTFRRICQVHAAG